MAITPVPSMTPVPHFPALSERALGTYNSSAYAFGTHMSVTFNGELLAVAMNVKNNADETLALANFAYESAEASALSALESDKSKNAALALANYQGDWSVLAGPYNKGISVRHSGQFWLLNENTSDITTLVPGVSAVWIAITQGLSIKSSDFTAVNGGIYACDTRATSFTALLPLNPQAGWQCTFLDYAGTFTSKPMIVARNGSNIIGVADNYSLNQSNFGRTFLYADSTKGWIVI